MTSTVSRALSAAEIAAAGAKYTALKARLAELAPVVVALSGGVDSSFLLAAAAEAVGPDAVTREPPPVVGAIGVSASLAAAELAEATAFAERLGVPARRVATHELDVDGYVRNAGDRCFFCKTELYERIREATRDVPGATVVDGTNASDVGDDRPGMTAASNLDVRSPLREVGLTKREIRHLSREMTLSTWDKPEAACLASRIATGIPVTAERLGRVEAAEAVLKRIGVRHVRVRHHDRTARIEADPAEMSRILAAREEVVAELTRLGYDWVTLDLGGYRKGGRALSHDEDATGRT